MPHVQNPATPKGWFHFLMISGPISSGICGPTTFLCCSSGDKLVSTSEFGRDERVHKR